MTTHPAPEPEADTRRDLLDAQACARLLAAVEFGRLAVVDAGLPVIVVLNHVVEGADVLFRTGEGALVSSLTAGGREIHAVFEVDSAFVIGRAGWSVIATGLLLRETDPGHVATAQERITAWADGERDVVLRLRVSHLTGRRVGSL